MLIDLQEGDVAPGEPYDAVVVGAGAVGLSLAVQLARQGKTVVVLEAGGLKTTQTSQSFFESAVATGHALMGLHAGRSRALGGTTNIWGGQLLAFDRFIFTERPWVSSAAWPIGREDIDPYYAATFKLLGMDRVILADTDVWTRLGVEPLKPSRDIVPFFTRWLPESNFARLFAADIKNLAGLHVCVNAPVTALVGSAGGAEVSGVQVNKPNGKIETVLGQHIILANGTIEIARLLKLPLADGTRGAWHRNAWIGTGFMDHVDCFAGAVTPIDKARFSEAFDNAYVDGIKYQPKLKLSANAQAEGRLFGAAAHLVFNSSASERITNLKVMMRGLLRGSPEPKSFANPLRTAAALRFLPPIALRYVRYGRMYNFSDRGIQLRISSEQSPLESSRVSLRGDSDALGMPRVDVDWQFNPEVLETMATFGERVRAYLAQTGLANVELDSRLLARDPSFLEDVNDAKHHMGTARMSKDAASGVVDSRLKVHGTANLFVAGAAVYPTTGFPNPAFTAMALGLRLVDDILSEHV
jgi:choline dehydrogenase-like flavoprotein